MKKLIALILFCSMYSCSPDYNGFTIRYEVEGSCNNYSIIIESDNSKYHIADNDWSYQITATLGYFTFISAKNNCADGYVWVGIYKNGYLWKENTSYSKDIPAKAFGQIQ